MADLLETGLYSVAQAARLLRTDKQKVRGWIAGYPRRHIGPILKNDIGWLGPSLAFSFANLMEIRFLQHFAARGVKMPAIRTMAQEAKRLLQHPHPFATKTVFTTDGKKIFADIAESTGDKKLYDLKAKNWAFLDIIEQSLKRDVTYDPAGDAAAWHPRKDIAPNVIIHPKIAFGQPVIDQDNVPTQTLFDAFEAEGETAQTVAAWFCVAPERVTEAVCFETDLAMAA